MQYYLAIDMGASSGRHILAYVEDGSLQTEEVYRFENKMIESDGSYYWDTKQLYEHILTGLKRCKEVGKIPRSLGIDTWGVDYLLLDDQGQALSEAYHYRDPRTEQADGPVHRIISESELYKRVGIQKMPFNTIYQLMADQTERPELLARAKTLLLMPSYFNYLLTGNKVNEYTHASTTALLDVRGRDWDWDLIERLGYPSEIFAKIEEPGYVVGSFTEEVRVAVGFDCEVLLPPSHDTASAYLAVPARDDKAVYLSSGTWSLLGVESDEPILTDGAEAAQFTNEGAYGRRYRFLKNIMGMWMVENIRREWPVKPSYEEMNEASRAACDFETLIDVNDPRFMAPESMIDAVRLVAAETGQVVPESLGELLITVYRSLAAFYAKSIRTLEEITGKQYTSLNIVGGGSQNAYLNELTARACGMDVLAGPSEATVIGNILSQMIANGELRDVESARELVRESFDIKVYNE